MTIYGNGTEEEEEEVHASICVFSSSHCLQHHIQQLLSTCLVAL